MPVNRNLPGCLACSAQGSALSTLGEFLLEALSAWELPSEVVMSETFAVVAVVPAVPVTAVVLVAVLVTKLLELSWHRVGATKPLAQQ